MTDSDKASAGDEDRPGATASFPYDRMTVERFRKSFPRARWRDELKAWFVPGKTAARRFDRWLERELAGSDRYADMKGRDAYAFDPVVSKYLLRHEDRLEVQTPYSRTVVDEMRQVPFASWDAERHVWTVPYRSYEDLRRRWERIEAAARRNEPDERKKRQAEKRGSEEERAARARALERRRRRYPVQADDLPPLERPVMTSRYGMVVFLGSDGEPAEKEILSSFYPDIPSTGDYVWAQWRSAQFDELIRTWPSRLGSKGRREGATWWPPTIEELRIARRAARRSERRQDRSSPTLPIDGIARPE